MIQRAVVGAQMPYRQSTIIRYSLWALLLVNILVAIRCTSYMFKATGPRRPGSSRTYDYIGDDYPLEFPTGTPLDTVGMAIDETVHYTLNSSDPVANEELLSILHYPKGTGRVRLGPDHRVFVVTYFHQLHCLRLIQATIMDPSRFTMHLQHCFNYLRQTLLCDAADSLEKGDFMKRDYSVERAGDVITCRDWERGFDLVDENFDSWTEFSKEWN